MRVLKEYEEKGEVDNKVSDITYDDDFEAPSADLLARIDEIRRDFTKYFSQSLSVNLNEKIRYEESENSGLFIIGDILRRNFKIYQQYHKYTNQYKLHE